MSGSILDDHWLRQQPQNGSLSWTTSISRTRVSTVGGLELREASDTHAVHSLEALLSIVQQLKLKRLPATELEETRFIAAGETFSVSECRYQNRTVAVKHVRLQEDAAKSDERYTQRRLQAVLREVLIMTHQPLAQHPNIIDLLGYGWVVKNQRLWPFVTVDFASEGSVREYLKREPRPFFTLLILIGDVGEGLLALHRCGIIHGDLKADNAVVFPSPNRPSGSVAKLSDFGHSIIMGSPSNTGPHYFGTRLYNAPEVCHQKEHPIPLEQLHKCDIWAFGLCVWEILADGEVYFKKDWLSNTGPVSTSTSRAGCLKNSGTPSSPSAFAGNQHSFERFEFSRLQPLALEFLSNRYIPPIHRPLLVAMLQKILQVDPAQRISDLSRLPIVGFWSKSFSRDRLQPKLTGFALSGATGYSMFSREDGRCLIWDQQEQLRQDFEAVALRHPTQEQEIDAAFQAMLCYINGFGTPRNQTMAMQYLLEAEASGHMVARIFGPRIRDGLFPGLSNEPRKYCECLALGFRAGHDPGTISKITMHNSEVATEFPNYVAFRTMLTSVLKQETQNVSEIEVTFNSSLHRQSMLEVAIQHDDAELVKRILLALREQSNNSERMHPLALAASRCNLPIVELFLEFGIAMPQDNANSILHWLFCFTGLNSHDLKHLVQRAGVDPASLNRVTTQNVAFHSQWPFQVNGSPLATAIASGSTAAVEALLALGADPLSPAYDASDNEFISQATPIHLAAKYHHPGMLQAFWKAVFGKDTLTLADARKSIALSNFPIACVIPLQTNAERYAIHGSKCMDSLRRTLELLPLELLEQRASDGRTIMTQAIDLEDVDTVELLVDRFPCLSWNRVVHPDEEGVYSYPLHFAVQIGFGSGTRETVRRTVQRILKSDPTAVNRPDSSGIKPMHLAAMDTSSSAAAFLLNEGASVHETDGRGQTPLHFCRNSSNVAFLLQKGAQIDQEDNYGFTAAHVAASNGRETVLQALIDARADITCQRNAVGTPLHSAISSKSSIMVEMLLNCGSDVNSLNSDGKGALQLALNTSRSDLALLLFKHGADPFLPDGHGWVPFFTSLAVEDPMVLARFQEHDGFKAMSKGDIHEALHFAAAHGRPARLSQFLQKIPRQLLLSMELERCHERYQRTPLHTAASACRIDLIEVLVSAGLKIDTVDEQGNTPLLLACQAGRTTAVFNPQDQINVCQELIANGADIFVKNNDGTSPLSVAQDRENYPLMTLLLEHVLAINDDHPPTRGLRILDSIQDPDCLERYTQRARALIGGVSLDWSLLKKAIVGMEADFLMTVIGGFFLNRHDVRRLLLDADSFNSNADQLCIYSARQDRSMVLYLLETVKRDYSDRYRKTLCTGPGARDFDKELGDLYRNSLSGIYWEAEAKRTGSGAVKENSGSISEPLSRTKSKLGRWSKSKRKPVPNANIVPYPGT